MTPTQSDVLFLAACCALVGAAVAVGMYLGMERRFLSAGRGAS